MKYTYGDNECQVLLDLLTLTPFYSKFGIYDAWDLYASINLVLFYDKEKGQFLAMKS